MPRRIHPNTENTKTLDNVFGEGKRAFDEWQIHGDKFQFYRAEAWLEHCQQTIPENCSAATKNRLEQAITQALCLCREAKIEDLIKTMEWADKGRDYHERSGTKAIWYRYRSFCDQVGGQHVDFRTYVIAAARAALKHVWKENDKITLSSLTGSQTRKLDNLIDYAQRLGFVVDVANDADGNVAVVLVGVKAQATSGKVVKRSK